MNRDFRVTSVSKRTPLALIAATLVIAAGTAVWTRSVQAQVSTPASAPASAPAAAPTPTITTVPGMPPVPDARNLYSETASGKWSPAVQGDLERVYVPNLRSNDVYVIDPNELKVIGRFKVGIGPQHIVPSWDLRTLWVTNNAEGRTDGSLTPIDPKTGKPGKAVMVDDPYNMYFSPDGKSAIVVAEARKRLDFRDPQTMAMQYSIDVPGCPGVNHADFSIDGRFAIFTCEFAGTLVKIDLAGHSQFARRQALLHRRHACRRRAHRRWRIVHAGWLHCHRPWRARSVPQPRRQAALRGQPGLAQDPRLPAWQRRRRGDRLRHREGGRALGRPWRRQPRHGQHQP